MSAVLEAREASARYLEAVQPALVRQFELLATSPGGVAGLRVLILALAVQGRLVPQDPCDESASALLARSRAHMRDKMMRGEAKKEKPASEVDESEKPFAAPNGWQWCRLTDTGEYVNGLAFKPSDWHADGLPIVRIQNLSGRNPDFNRTKGDFDRSVIVSAGDILVSWSATLDAFIWQGETGVLNQHIFRVEPAPCVDKSFLYWLLKWAIKDLADSDHAHGLVMSHINRGPFLAKPVLLPPLAEQARIVARVDELMRLCDALEAKGRLEAEQHARLLRTLLGTLTDSSTPEELAANWQRVADHFDLLLDRPEAVDALEQTILQLAVRGLLVPQDPSDEPATALLDQARIAGNCLDAKPASMRGLPAGEPQVDQEFRTPSGWEWVSLADLLPEFQNGVASRGDTGGRQITVLRLADIKARRVSLADTRQIPIAERDIEKYRLRSGDILITRVNGSADIVGQFNLCEEEVDAIYCDHFIRLRVRTDWLDPAFTAILGESDLIRNRIRGLFITTAGQKTVNQGHIGSLRFALPPWAEQIRIVTRVTQLRCLCAELRQRLTSSQTTQSRLAEALIAEVA